VLFDKLDTGKMHGLNTLNMSCRDVTSEVEFGLICHLVMIVVGITHHYFKGLLHQKLIITY